jgi:hypothetical protein
MVSTPGRISEQRRSVPNTRTKSVILERLQNVVDELVTATVPHDSEAIIAVAGRRSEVLREQ